MWSILLNKYPPVNLLMDISLVNVKCAITGYVTVFVIRIFLVNIKWCCAIHDDAILVFVIFLTNIKWCCAIAYDATLVFMIFLVNIKWCCAIHNDATLVFMNFSYFLQFVSFFSVTIKSVCVWSPKAINEIYNITIMVLHVGKYILAIDIKIHLFTVIFLNMTNWLWGIVIFTCIHYV